MKSQKTISILAILIFTSFSFVYAQDDAAYLKYRQNLMKANGMYMGMIGDIMKSGLPLQGDIKYLAETVANNARLFESAWEKKITEGRTDSKPEIWQQWGNFVQAANASAAAADELSMAATKGKGAIMAALRETGGTCGGCHRNFRKPKSQRFKR